MIHLSNPRKFASRQRGSVLIYSMFALTALIAISSLAVDLGRAQLAKTELRRAADAAARYGAAGFANNSITANAIAVAAQNKVDGSPLVLTAADITQVTWNASAGTIVAGNPSPNAVQISAKRINSRGTGIPTLFAAVLGRKTIDVTVTSIATYTPAANVTLVARATNNPWLAGMPNGTTANGYDRAPAQSPTQVTGITITPGNTMAFDFTGSAGYLPGKSFGPDGDLTRMIFNAKYVFAAGREHGKSNLTAPIASVIAVFLDNYQPDLAPGGLPPDLDFTTSASRDYASLSPLVRQPFFIGNGLRNDGVTKQKIVVPPGATRLFIGIMDGQQWNDNAGSFSTSISQPGAIRLVR